MPKKAFDPPEDCIRITKYAQLYELVRHFVAGDLPLVGIIGRPGLSKSKTLEAATKDTKHLYLKGRTTTLKLYIELYNHKDQPIILDDTSEMLADTGCRELIKHLTETDPRKLLQYQTMTRILDNLDIERSFWTSSTCCIITNYWTEQDNIMQALASRAELVHFDPDWEEVYREASKWFQDQEIFDYVYERLHLLREPDLRILVKAYNRKRSGMRHMTWQALIDSYCDDHVGMVVRRLVEDPSYETEEAKVAAFEKETNRDRSTYFRRKARIERYRPTGKVRKLSLKNPVDTVTFESAKPRRKLSIEPPTGNPYHPEQ
jgi:hypothetical protein